MSAQTGSAAPAQKENTNPNDSVVDKGKGKAAQDVTMDDDESSSEEDVDEVSILYLEISNTLS